MSAPQANGAAAPPDRTSELQLLQGTRAFFPALMLDIEAAQTEVRLETYIFDLNGGGENIASALQRAAQRGVAVCVLVDGFGTPRLSGDRLQRMQEAGVQWRTYAPLGRWWFLRPVMWRRLHRKLICIDGRVAYCGGINILDDFHDPNHGALEQPRFDFSVRVTGELATTIGGVMHTLWERVGMKLEVKDVVTNPRKTGARMRHTMTFWFDQLREQMQRRNPSRWPRPHALQAELVLRDNWRNRTHIERAYLQAIRQATREVLIANAYFVPGRSLQQALLQAARRGVKVQLLLQGRYEYFMQYYAARPVYASLLEAGVEIHEYSASFLHAKVAVIDGEWATVGSSNLDPLSLLMAREANVVTRNQPFAQELRQQLLDAMATCGEHMDAHTFASRPWTQRAKERLALMTMRFGLLILGRRYL